MLMKRTDKGWVDLSWNQVGAQVDALASYMIDIGLQKGDILSIYSQNRPEWVSADYATFSCGAVNASISPTNSAPEAAYILDDTKSVICFCEGKFQVDNVLAERNNLPALKDIIVTSGGKNVAPQVLENTFASNPFIEQIAVLGDGKKYIVALIVPNFETLKEWAAKEGLAELSKQQLVTHEKVIKKYEEVINELNQHFGRVAGSCFLNLDKNVTHA